MMTAPSRTAFTEHPYTPYPIQQQFMEQLHQTLEDGSVGLLESPTGTGKTISIICGALHWLEDFRERAKEADAVQAAEGGIDDDDPDWLRGHQVEATTSAPEPHPWLKRRGLVAAGGRHVVQAHTLGGLPTSRRTAGGGEATGATDASASAANAKGSTSDGLDDQFLLAPTAADADDGGGDGGGAKGVAAAVGTRRARLRALLEEDTDSGEEGCGGGGEADDRLSALRALRAPPAAPARTPQVFFASRTHSQLAQFVSELRRTGFASRLRLVSLASRRGLCVHEPVAALGSAGLITERCTELQECSKGGGSKARRTGGCAGGGDAAAGGGGGSCAAAGTAANTRPGPGPGSGRGRGSCRSWGNPRGGGGGGGCPYLAPSLEAAEDFAAAVLSQPQDVEDLGRAGRRLGLCPYYGSRALLSEADIVALPYSALLCEETRGSLGLRIDGSVVIFDEAHNLVDAVTSSHGSQVSLEQLGAAARQLSAYFSRFQMRLSPASARNVQLLLRLATALQRCLEQPPPQQPPPQHPGGGDGGDGAASGVAVLCCHDFLLSLRLEHLNLFPLLSWVRESRLVMKVAGYDLATRSRSDATGTAAPAATTVEAAVDLYDDEDGERGITYGATRPSTTGRADAGAAAASGGGQRCGGGGAAAAAGFGARRSSLFAFISFLTALTHPSADGRIVIAAGGGTASASAAAKACLRYTVLNAAAQFASIVAAARSVVLASGTLSPVEGLVAQLLPGVPSHRVRHFSCGHVVPRENLIGLVAARGPTGLELDLRHRRRADPAVCDELGRLLVNICTAVPAGVVVFAPSFAYLDQLVTAWQRPGSGVWAGLTTRKHVFVEPRSAGEVEAVLTSYAAAIRRTGPPPSSPSSQPATAAAPAAAPAAGGLGSGRRPHGAVLLSVVGGKLSEGINFGDDLGRCVVVLGLPYPNPSDPELRERMRYLDEAATATTATTATAKTALATTAATAATAASSRAVRGSAVVGAAGGGVTTASSPPCLTGQQYYEGLCIKAVNQCVGRVIRHARDYAAIVLVDARFMPPPAAAASAVRGARGGDGSGGGGVVGGLPAWIQQSLVAGTGDFAHLYGKLVGFFRGRPDAGAPSALPAAPPAAAIE